MTGLTDLTCDEKYKIDLINLSLVEKELDKKSFFGDWIHNVDALRTQFENAKPLKILLSQIF